MQTRARARTSAESEQGPGGQQHCTNWLVDEVVSIARAVHERCGLASDVPHYIALQSVGYEYKSSDNSVRWCPKETEGRGRTFHESYACAPESSLVFTRLALQLATVVELHSDCLLLVAKLDVAPIDAHGRIAHVAGGGSPTDGASGEGGGGGDSSPRAQPDGTRDSSEPSSPSSLQSRSRSASGSPSLDAELSGCDDDIDARSARNGQA